MQVTIALVGNPNSGKTTLFNALTGSNQYVGNWPGVTVEKKEGTLRDNGDVIITDLPGIYSLSPYTLEEVVARNYLLGENPDGILNIVDGTNLERNLYLTTQLVELGIPVVVAINMMDVLRRRGESIDIDALAVRLGCPVVEISALKGTGLMEAAELALATTKVGAVPPAQTYSPPLEDALARITSLLGDSVSGKSARWYAVKAFERDEKALESLGLSPEVSAKIEAIIVEKETAFDDDCESIITDARYNAIAALLAGHHQKPTLGKETLSDKIDKVLTHRFLALPIFVLVMWFVYFLSIGSIGDWTVGFMNETLFGEWIIPSVTTLLESWQVAGWLVSLIGDGILSGVGAVLGFVPQMLILFLLLSILEDCGYMSRIAFIMDRLFRRLGLSGKSFIPLLVGTGCSVPGIMASRTIEQQRDRRLTIMTTAFIPCGAKMPIVGMIAGALFGGNPWIAVLAYFIGVSAVVISALMLKKTKPFRGEEAPFVMELPAYHAPIASNVLRTTWDRGWSFIKRAGSVILLASVLIWVFNSLSFEGGFHYITAESGGASILEWIGVAIAWIFRPLGFGTWQAAVATILGLVAKEEVVGTFGTLSSMASADLALEGDAQMYETIAREFFGGSALAGLSFLVFNLLCAPCFGAMGAIKREMNDWRWTAFTIGYMCVFAYAISLIVYQFGAWFISAGSVVGTIVAALALGIILYMLFRPDPYRKGVKHN